MFISLYPRIASFTVGAALRECRRVKDYEVVIAFSAPRHFGEQVENVAADKRHPVGQPVYLRVALCHCHRVLRDIDGGDVLRASHYRVQRKRTGVSEAVEDTFSLRNACGGKAVVFLIEEKPGFLSVYVIDRVLYAVLTYDDLSGRIIRKPSAE